MYHDISLYFYLGQDYKEPSLLVLLRLLKEATGKMFVVFFFQNIYWPAVARQLPGGSQSEVISGPLEGACLVVHHAVQSDLLPLPDGDVLGLLQELLLPPSDGQEDWGEQEELHSRRHREEQQLSLSHLASR